jgi:hypothetical protein
MTPRKRQPLIGRRVLVSISEPWEFESEVGTGSLPGRVRDVRDDDIVVALDEAVSFGGRTIEAVLAAARYKGDRAAGLGGSGRVVCNFTDVALASKNGPYSAAAHLVGSLHLIGDGT